MNQVMLLFKDEKLQPITPLKTMGLADVEKAFKTMQSWKAVGKLVLEPTSYTLINCAPKAVPPIKISQ